MSPSFSVWPLTAALLLAGCTSFDMQKSTSTVDQELSVLTKNQLRFASDQPQWHAMREQADKLLQQPLSQDDAVQLSLLNQPAMQELLARYWASGALTAQSGRLSNPLLTLERSHTPGELEISRMLSAGLLDVLTLPQKKKISGQGLQQLQWQLASDVVGQITQLRSAWVRAVAAQQSASYADQVNAAAQASAELAARMRAAGNFSQLQAARQEAFSADASAQLLMANHARLAAREELVRALGLDTAQALQLQLPEHLPAIPPQPLAAEDIAAAATANRLDIRQASAALNMARAQQGLGQITSLTDIELTVKNNSLFDQGYPASHNKRGVEVVVRLPLFDWGDQQRAAMNAGTLAAAYQLESVMRNSGSTLRESYSSYLTTHAIARHYQKVVLPLRQQISEQNQLRYNGMLIGVFDLLADSREQMNSVISAIAAYQDFWLADAALQAELLGKPMTTTMITTTPKNQSSAVTH